MPTFPKPQPDTLASLDGFRIGALVHDNSGTLTVELLFSVAILSTAGNTRQINGDLSQYLTAAQITNFTNVALALYAKAQVELLT